MEELKPCPFCGGEAEFIKRKKQYPTKGNPNPSVGEIKCRECLCGTGMRASYGLCVSYWNTRYRAGCVNLIPQDNETLHCSECGYLTESRSFPGNEPPRFCSFCGNKVLA